MITCHIVRGDNAVQANYGAMRGNDCQAEGVHKPFVHELVFILEGLAKQFGNEKAIEAVERYGKALAFGYDEIAAVRKIGAWPVECISSLSSILNSFQCLGTLDGKTISKRQSKRIMDGNIVEVPKILLKKVAKVDPEFIKQNAHFVLEKKASLKDLVEEFFKHPKRVKTASCVIEISGFQTMEQVQKTCPGKFDDEVLDKYEGAVIGENANSSGEALQEYCTKVFSGKDIEPITKFFQIESFAELDFCKWSGYDLIILSSDKILDETLLQLQTLRGLKTEMSILLQVGEKEEGFKTYMKFASSYEILNPRLLHFQVEDETGDTDFCENIKMGILLPGTIHKPPISALNRDLPQLVNKLVFPGSKIAFAFEGRPRLVRLHTDVSCDYYGSKLCLEEFKKELGIDSVAVGDQEQESEMEGFKDVDEGVENESPGPSGFCNSTLSDSGFQSLEASLDISEIKSRNK